MRPIDADKLMRDIEHYHVSDGCFQHWVELQPTIDTMPIVPVAILKPLLMQYFCVGGDCYTYELTRVKEAYELGTMTLDDFVEWDEEQVDDLVSYIVNNVSVLRR